MSNPIDSRLMRALEAVARRQLRLSNKYLLSDASIRCGCCPAPRWCVAKVELAVPIPKFKNSGDLQKYIGQGGIVTLDNIQRTYINYSEVAQYLSNGRLKKAG